MSITLTLNKFRYLISVKTLGVPEYCNYPREVIVPHMRSCRTVYYSSDGTGKVKKEIIYPRELWYSHVDSTDPVENIILDIKNEWPNWYKIEILTNF